MINEMAKNVKLAQAASDPTKIKRDIESDYKVSADQVHGLPSHPGVPMRDLIQNRFGNDAEQETTLRYEQYFEQRKEKGFSHTVVRETKASTIRSESLRYRKEQPVKEPFKMTKFKRVASRIKPIWDTVQSSTIHTET